ncbi:MAG: hypothetical protein ACLGSD_17370 [Acidobacteriota bacterium]
MTHDTLVAAIDAELERLQQARKLLTYAEPARKAFRAKKTAAGRKRRKLSAEGRARIAEAQRKRWAEKKSARKKNDKAA